MGPRTAPEWRPRQTLIDLYNEKDSTPWYFRLLATISALMLALGFFILPSSYIKADNFTVTHMSALAAGVALVVVPTLVTLILSICLKSLIFHLDIVFMPHLTSSLLGLLGTIYAVTGEKNAMKDSRLGSNAIATISVSVALTLIYGTLSLLTFRKIYIVRARDALHRPTTKNPGSEGLPETEQQRKQLLRLLLQQEESQTSSPDTTTSHTFKIDLPDGSNSSHDRSHRNTLNTLRNFPRFGASSRYASRRSSMMGGPPADHLTGGIERVPTMIREESTMNDSLRSAANGISSMTVGVPTPLRPVMLPPRAQSGLFNTAGADDRSRAPSYCENAHPSMHLDVDSGGLPQLQENGYPIEKPRSDAPERSEQHRTEYRLAPPEPGRGGNGNREGRNSRSRRDDIELADRGKEGTRIRPELDGRGPNSRF